LKLHNTSSKQQQNTPLTQETRKHKPMPSVNEARSHNNNAIALNLQESKETKCKAHHPQGLSSHHHRLPNVCHFLTSNGDS
jgi:hypothetical protein